jgi:hypothetical protein
LAFACDSGVGVACTQKKWEKAKQLVTTLQQELHSDGLLEHKNLERIRGFFIHMQRTYPVFTPFLKGMHLTLDGWHDHKDEESWPILHSDPDTVTPTLGTLSKAPHRVTPAARLADDLLCLSTLLDMDEPPTCLIRASRRLVVIYGFVDASSSGFGGSFALPDGSVYFRHGIWGRDSDSDSSNFREFNNLVESLEDSVLLGELANSELYVFTDNTSVEGAYYKGNSPSRRLFELVLRLRCIEMKASIKLFIIHVAGSRMISQGTDGLSRGNLSSGIFATSSMALHIPLHLLALDRCTSLLPWIQSWVPDAALAPLSPMDWFDMGHGIQGYHRNLDGMLVPQPTTQQWFLWTPPPAAGRAAMEELATSRHQQTHLNHVFIIPRLFTSQWRRLLYKFADIVFEIPPGSRDCWPLSMHEPLVVGLTFRFLSHSPWTLQRHRCVLELERELRQVWQTVQGDERTLLRKLCLLPSTLEPMSQCMAR